MDENPAIKREKLTNGLIYGLFAALGFAITTWGVDGFFLWRASADYPWLKFMIGAPIILLLGGLAGWITARINKRLAGFLVWILAGVTSMWIASHVPFEVTSTIIGFLEPSLQGADIYPFIESSLMRMSLFYILAGIFTGFIGLLELTIITAAERASHAVIHSSILMVGLLLYLPFGILTDNWINKPLRVPLLAIDQIIHESREAGESSEPQERSHQIIRRVMKPFGDLIHEPYRLTLGHYDPGTLNETSIYVDFDGIWGNCYVLGELPTHCLLSTDVYMMRLACLANSGSERSCSIKTTPQALDQMESMVTALGETWQIQVGKQIGNTIQLVIHNDTNLTFQCNLKASTNIVVESCQEYLEAVEQQTPMEIGIFDYPNDLLSSNDLTEIDTEESLFTPLHPSIQIEHPALHQVPRYEIKLVIDFEASAYNGIMKVEYTNLEDTPLEQLFFRLLPNGGGSFGDGSLEVVHTLVGGRLITPSLSLNDTVLEVQLTQPLLPGERLQAEFEFRGRVPLDFSREADSSGYGIFNMSQEVMALAGWYPTLAVYDKDGWNLDYPSNLGDSIFSDIAYYSVEIEAPDLVQVLATGVLTNEQVSGGRVIRHFESGPARDFFIIASPHFQSISREVQGTMVNAYYLPGHQRGGKEALSVASDSLQVFNQVFGQYPYSEFDIVEAPMHGALGVEFPGVVLVSSSLYDAPEKPEFVTTVAHEVAHQWWYNIVGNDVFEEPWLDEALTTYSSSLYYEFGPVGVLPQGLIDYWQGRYDTLREEGNDDLITNNLEHFENLASSSIYGGVVYSKGALFFHALRGEIGTDSFFVALQYYYRAYQYQIATGELLLEIFEVTSGRQLNEFFQQWLYAIQRE